MDFLESFPLHERTYKYHARNFNFGEDHVIHPQETVTRLECERCPFFEEVTYKAMAKGETLIQPIYIQTRKTTEHYLLCPACRLNLKGRVKEWVNSSEF